MLGFVRSGRDGHAGGQFRLALPNHATRPLQFAEQPAEFAGQLFRVGQRGVGRRAVFAGRGSVDRQAAGGGAVFGLQRADQRELSRGTSPVS